MITVRVKNNHSRVLFGSGRIWKNGLFSQADGWFGFILNVSTINFDLKTPADQARLINGFSNFLNSLDYPIQVVVRSRRLDGDSYWRHLKPHLSGEEAAIGAYRDLINRLIVDHRIIRRQFYVVVGVNLKRPDPNLAMGQLGWRLEAIIAGLAQIGLKADVCRQDIRSILSIDGLRAGRLKETPTHIVAPGLVARTLVVSDWPLIAGFGWLNRLINYPADLDLSYHYRPVAAAIAQSSLIRRITEIESRKRSLLKKGHLVGPEINDSLESAISLRNQIQRGLEKLFLVSLLITVRARRISDLDRQVAQIETLLAGHLFGTRPAYYQQLPGFGSTRPRGHNFVGAWRNLDSSCAALTWPFVGSELTNPAGILYGINQTDNSLVLIDRFSLANSNSLIFAQSGAGKSYAAKVEILRQLLVGVRVIVIDPENEYQRLAIKAGGAVIRLGPGSPNRLNLFDRLIWGDDPDDNQRLSDLATIIEILIGSIDDEARLILEAGLDRIYRTKQTQIGIDDLIGIVSDQRPDIGRRLVALKAGPLASLVQEETRIGSEPSLVVFSLDDWPDRYRAGVSLLISAYVAAMGRRHMNKRLLVIDEAWMLLGDRRASSILAGFVRRARKNYIGVCLISQQADDFLSSEAGRTIAAQSALKLILRTDTTAIRPLSRQFRLSEIEQQYLLTAAVGHGLLIAETKHTTVAIVASKEEHPLITTDPAEKDSQSRAGGQQ